MPDAGSAMSDVPRWEPPTDIVSALGDDGVWEDERWSPILLSVTSGTEHQGRPIPVAWQIEFDPWQEEFEAANARLQEAGIEPDGYGWCEYIRGAIRAADPGLVERLHFDAEMTTCVIWVESERDCRDLLMATWRLIVAARGRGADVAP